MLGEDRRVINNRLVLWVIDELLWDELRAEGQNVELCAVAFVLLEKIRKHLPFSVGSFASPACGLDDRRSVLLRFQR